MLRSPTAMSPHASALLDLVTHIQIQPELPICHPHYPPSEVTPEIRTRFQKLSPEMQQDYLSQHLRNYLYDIYYSGELKPLTAEADQPTPTEKNNTYRGIDAAFYAQIHQANQGNGYFDPDWQVVQKHSTGTLAVKKEGLTVQIEPKRHLATAKPLPRVGESVAIRLPRNRLETGYYVAVGNAGMVAADQPVVEISLHLSAEGAIAALHSLTTAFNAAKLPFQFKVLMEPPSYPRSDAGVLLLEQRHYKQARPLLASLVVAVRSHLAPAIPLFTKPLAPGIGLAEEPDDEQDFGLSRCQLVADALLEADVEGDRSPEARLAAIEEEFRAAELDWQRPYLNPDSEDAYEPLEGFV